MNYVTKDYIYDKQSIMSETESYILTKNRLKSLQNELTQWNSTWARLMSQLNSVAKQEPQFPKTGDEQRAILENLVQYLINKINNPDSLIENNHLKAEISTQKSYIEKLESENQLLQSKIDRLNDKLFVLVENIKSEQEDNMKLQEEIDAKNTRLVYFENELNNEQNKSAHYKELLTTKIISNSPQTHRDSSIEILECTPKSDSIRTSPKSRSSFSPIKENSSKPDSHRYEISKSIIIDRANQTCSVIDETESNTRIPEEISTISDMTQKAIPRTYPERSSPTTQIFFMNSPTKRKKKSKKTHPCFKLKY